MNNRSKIRVKAKVFFLGMLFPGLFLACPGFSQKVEDSKVWSTFHKSQVVQLKPQYSTYSVEYDFGNMVAPAKEQTDLQDLKLVKNDADLVLKVIVKNLYIGEKTIKEQSVKDKKKYYYQISYKANYGYELTDRKNEKLIQEYKRKDGSYTTATFDSKNDLDTYVKNAFMADILELLQTRIQKRIQYDLNEQNYDVRLSANSIKGESPAYSEINKAVTEFSGLVADKAADKEKLTPVIAVWEKHLAKADWKGKSEINKKVANALIENLCGAYLLMENYDKLREKAELHENNNAGIFANLNPLMFEIDNNYTGPSYSYHTIKRNNKFVNYFTPKYSDFSYDLLSVRI
jgi:hypothetical protein